MPGQRADARRNYSHILTVAEAEVAAHGADASLEQIARVAGVGSATVRRHFPTRQALLEAVFHGRVQTLCERAEQLGRAEDSRAALLAWLRDFVAYAVAARGLADTLAHESPAQESAPSSCATVLEAAGAPLLSAAIRDGAVKEHVTFHDLVTLTVGIALATENHSEPAPLADRLLRLAIEGVSPRGDS
ncbi:TetR/AcrR family transcriptional regulator [Streptomyces tsukubensis]|uniref:TetR family transcriptional regulator n=1 Tax=Streptomyces tsukubensis TaxID=83656 RepID=A0A1V4A4C0_9ACTN|nr:TetR/AcrR family transcriptional regulator [Streptomyces tsukubensis]OON74696.1 TetR family transcriptional regulator [Streptomyces tsukubensis]QFR93033.1 TetR family transcriptional regulator [Streptomyces tsukubensis]